MRVLISAYACEPHRGSEPEVGLRMVLAAAREHDVWVLTRRNNTDSIATALHDYGVSERVQVIGIDSHGLAYSLKKRGLPELLEGIVQQLSAESVGPQES